MNDRKRGLSSFLSPGTTTIGQDALLILSGNVTLERVLNIAGTVIRIDFGVVSSTFSAPVWVEDLPGLNGPTGHWDFGRVDYRNQFYLDLADQQLYREALTAEQDGIVGTNDNDGARGMLQRQEMEANDRYKTGEGAASKRRNQSILYADAAYNRGVTFSSRLSGDDRANYLYEIESQQDQAVNAAQAAYQSVEETLYQRYLSELDGIKSRYYDGAVRFALDLFKSTLKDGARNAGGPHTGLTGRSGLPDVWQTAADIFNGNLSTRNLEIILRTTSVSRASLAVAYWQQFGRRLPLYLNATQQNLLSFGQSRNPEAARPPEAGQGFFARMARWVDDGSRWVGSVTWTDITDATKRVGETLGSVYTNSASYVTNMATMLVEDPSGFARTVVDGYVNTSAVVANTFTFGLIPSLDAHAQQLMDNNSFYRVVQIGAMLGREIAIGAVTGGVGSLAIGGLARLAPAVACRAISAQRLFSVYSVYGQVDSLTANIDQAARLVQRGDGWRAAELVARSAMQLPGLIGGFREVGRLATGLSGGAQGIRNYLANCFAAGTPIRGEFGDKPIEEFQPGDRVWSRDEFDPTAAPQLREIEKCFVTEATIWHVHVGGKAIRTTESHPFWVANRGEWVSTMSLVPGDLLIGSDGRTFPVREVYSTNAIETVYNFSIGDDHTYFVGGETWRFDVWAHNACATPAYNRTRNDPARPPSVQAHHLNQDAAFGRIGSGSAGPIAYGQGVCVYLSVPAHRLVHRELNKLWQPYRGTGFAPTVTEYNRALYSALRTAGLPQADLIACLRAARRQQISVGYTSGTIAVPRVPGT